MSVKKVCLFHLADIFSLKNTICIMQLFVVVTNSCFNTKIVMVIYKVQTKITRFEKYINQVLQSLHCRLSSYFWGVFKVQIAAVYCSLKSNFLTDVLFSTDLDLKVNVYFLPFIVDYLLKTIKVLFKRKPQVTNIFFLLSKVSLHFYLFFIYKNLLTIVVSCVTYFKICFQYSIIG